MRIALSVRASRVAPVTLIVHRAERADLLVPGLAAVLREPQADPFAMELVLVPARGVERWLSQQLSHLLGNAPGSADGVCAGVEFRSPASLIAEVLGTRDEDPWHPDVLAWSVLRVLDRSVGEPWARVVVDHLGYLFEPGSDEFVLRQGRRFAVARRLAGLLAAYAGQRPHLLVDWEAGGNGDGTGRALPADLAWQPELWRRVLADVGAPSPVVRHRDVVAALSSGSLALDLPPRLSLFGHTRLSRSEAELLAAVGERREVHVWMPHPSDALWAARAVPSLGTRRLDDESHLAVEHPLLATMGRDVREAQAVLEAVHARDGGAVPGPTRPRTLLGAIQADIAAARAPRQAVGLGEDTGVRGSVQVHACHGPARQVEVLREVLLNLLDADPTLEPRDIVVMCPDIDVFAPLIQASFGLGEAVAGSHPGHRLRVMLADRSPTQTNPLLGVLTKILDLGDGRAEASRVLDLLAEEPVRRRFGFSESDLETLTRWVTNSGIRWGWDERGRAAYGLDAFVQNTWKFGLDRVLAGVALSDDSDATLKTTAPYDDVSTTDIALAGRLAEAIERLQRCAERFGGAHGAAEWFALLSSTVERLAEPAYGEEWQQAQLHRELSALGEEAGESTVLRLGDIRAMLHRQLGGRPTRANFRTGTLTICTLTPMRSVPHRVVCLLGIDDRVFPRGGTLDGDDVLGRIPLVGERDQRGADRQLFLDAVMAATEHLVISYTGFHESTGAPRPPAVPLREFLDVVEVAAPGFKIAEHKSQAFHPAYLGVPERGVLLPQSYDSDSARAARVAASPRHPAPRLIDVRLPPAPLGDIALTDLREAVFSPAKAFVRQRLMTEVPRERDEVSDSMPAAVGGLAAWQSGDRMLQALLRRHDLGDVLHREWQQGAAPPGAYGWHGVKEAAKTAHKLVEEFRSSIGEQESTDTDVDIKLADGRRVVGTVPGVFGNRLVRVGYSTLGAKSRLQLWLDLVALSAADPGAGFVGRTIGRGPEAGVDPVRGTFRPVVDPLGVLESLVALHDRALTQVIPLEQETARAWALVVHRRRNAPDWMIQRDAREAWNKSRPPELTHAWGRRPRWEEARDLPGPDGQPVFGHEALGLWLPILQSEEE